VTTRCAITAAALANCLGTDSRTVLDRAFAGDDALSPAGAFCELPFQTMLGVMPGMDRPRGQKGPRWIDSRDATRGGVNGPALPGPGGRESPLEINLDCIPTRLAMAALPSVRQLRPAVRAAVDRWGARRVAYVFASSTGGLDETERALAPDPRLPLASAGYRYTDHGIDATSQAIARHLGVEGVCTAISTACSSSFHALASALRLIDRGLADAAVVGSADSLCRTTVFGFHSLGLTAPAATRPFARDRAGITLGEGSAYALVERDAPDTRRRALAWIAGIGAASDAFHHTSPHPDGLGGQLCMRQALDRAGLSPDAIDCVSAHGTGTRLNDAAEATAVRQVFGRRVPLTATKSLTGHTLGSAGLTALVLALESLRRQAIPATPRATPLDEALGVDVVDRLTAAELRHVLVNAFGFGGSNVSVVVSRPDTERS
jgi:3-oxoacyl-[acyl-carrier-protein] synthase-1